MRRKSLMCMQKSYSDALHALKGSVPDPMSYSMPAKLDQGWHALLLETQEYADLCSFLTGVEGLLVHHSTRTANDPIDIKNVRVESLKDLYQSTYHEDPDSWCWDIKVETVGDFEFRLDMYS